MHLQTFAQRRLQVGASVLAMAAALASPSLAQERATSAGNTIDEIIVTAQKRAENVQDVPIAITALSEATLLRTGADRFETFLALSPGVNFAGVNGNSSISIRGVSTSLYTSNEQGTIEVLFDDMPSLNRYYSRFNSDMRLVDVERVEVLRGPQGTLFGSGSLGGAIRIINNKPDTTVFAGSLQAGVSTTKGGDGGHDLKGMVNLPLVNDRLALRIVGYSIREGGFIDNIVRKETDVNFTRSSGARAMLTYTPNDRLSVTASAWQQRDRTGGDSVAFLNPAEGGKYQSGSVDPEDATKGWATLYNLTTDYDFGPVRLLSSSSYVRRSSFIDRDFTTFWQAPNQANFKGDVEDWVTARTKMFNQEVRLTSDHGGPLQWVVGGYYLKQDVDVLFRRTIQGLGAAKNYSSDLLSELAVDPSTTEVAGFGEASYRIVPALTLTAGARVFKNTLNFASDRSGFLGGLPTPRRTRSENSVTPKFAATYEIRPGLNLYAQAAKGYRTGQNNFVSLPDAVTGKMPPEAYGPDNLWNYEIGFKSMWFERRLKLNVAAFYIDWKNIQLTRRDGTTTFTDNAGDAFSRGFELELEARPTEWLSFGIAPSYTDAQLKSVLPGVPVRPGALPGSPKWALADFVQVTRRLGPDAEGFVRLDHRFVGRKDTALDTVAYAPANWSDPYHLINLRVGASFRRYEINAYVNNLTNNDAALASRSSANTFIGTIRQRPRTIGVLVRATY